MIKKKSVDVSFRISSVKASCESLIQHLTQLNKGSVPTAPVDEMVWKTQLGGPVGREG